MKSFKDFEFEDLDADTKGTVIILGISIIFKRIALAFLIITLVALVLWFGKLTIFIVAIQSVLFISITRIQNYFFKKAKKQILKE